MSNENTNQDIKMDTNTGAPEETLTTDEKLENLARNVFMMREKVRDMSTALDNVYIQVATLIEVLADNPEILNPTIWEEKLKEVTQNIKDTMEAIANEEGNREAGIVTDPDGTDAPKGNSKIILPNTKIIIPGQ